MIKYYLALGLSLILASPVMAGSPIKDSTTCPIGGQKFKTTSTASCSTMGRTLSMQPITSCDFITRLPQCPKNKLPMYKDFTDADLAELKSFMKTPAYKKSQEKSPYYLAYVIDKNLTSSSVETQFYLLQQGLWYTPASQKNDDYLTAYHQSLEAALAQKEFEGKPFWRGAQAWLAMENGDAGMAELNIEVMKTENEDDSDYLATYISALTYCLKAEPNDELCTSQTSLREHEKPNPAQ